MKYKCIVSYDGYGFNGYQIQKHDKNTIQENIQHVLSYIFKESIVIYASGRTDKGVHALGQVFHFESAKIIPCENIKKSLNENLPLGIRILKVSKASSSFHARYSSHAKIYEYRIINKEDVDAFKNRYYAFIKEPLDINLLKEASKLFIGTHDFKNFTTNKKEEVESFVKTIYDVKVVANNKKISITFKGSGFLRYQVRMMVGALLAVSLRKQNISYITLLLEDKCDNKCSYKAEPQGLYLKKVIYGGKKDV